MKAFHPILTCQKAAGFEDYLFAGDAQKSWHAMQQAGAAIGQSILFDYRELRPIPEEALILTICGNGHNGGDAALATAELLKYMPGAEAEVIVLVGSGLKENCERAINILMDSASGRARMSPWRGVEDHGKAAHYHIVIDGLLGMKFSPPLREPADAIVRWANHLPSVDLRAAVDLSSGLGDGIHLDIENAGPGSNTKPVFKADFTYTPGIAKAPIFYPRNAPCVGRVRYHDLGFFQRAQALAEEHPEKPAPDVSGVRTEVVTCSVLGPLSSLRPQTADKRAFGNLVIVAGSRTMPGAAFMAALAAVRSGGGLVTACVPESVQPAFAASLPEVMWVPVPETASGAMSPEAWPHLIPLFSRADAVVAGMGMGATEDALAMVRNIVEKIDLPTVLDADALRPEIVEWLRERAEDEGKPVVLTPHHGELARMMRDQNATYFSDDELLEFAGKANAIVSLKGGITRIAANGKIYHRLEGGPILSRGGSGDVLAGMMGALLSRPGTDVATAVCQANMWHGLAAEARARKVGQTAVRTTEILDELAGILRRADIAAAH